MPKMITKRLESAIVDIDALIELTRSDIKDSKEAKHESLSIRLQEKEDLIKSFENKKALLSHELMKLAALNDGKSIDEILNEKESDYMSLFKEKLKSLKQVNKEYSRFVATISEFYTSLVDKMFTLEGDGYDKNRLAPAAIFTVSA
jgi:predicted nuclease with TOPRIM domain